MVAEIAVVNRTVEKAEEVAKPFRWQRLMDLSSWPKRSGRRILSSVRPGQGICAHPGADCKKQCWAERKDKPLFMIDIAVPRDLDPAIGQLEKVFLYDIDDLNGIVEANLEEREKEALEVETMIEEEVTHFRHWFTPLGVGVRLITALQEKAKAIQEEAMRKIENKLPDLTENELRLIRKYTKSIVNQMMHDPIVRIKEMAAQRGSKEAFHSLPRFLPWKIS